MRRALLLVLLAACSDSTGTSDPVRIVPRGATTLQVGEQVQLEARWADETRSSVPQAAWASSDTGVVRVSESGLASARFPGTALVTAQSGAARDTVRLTVAPVEITWSGLGAVPERYTAEVSARGRYAYTTTWGSRLVDGVTTFGNAIKVWDVLGDAPVLVDSVIVTDDAPAVSARPLAALPDADAEPLAHCHHCGEEGEAVSTLGDVQVSDDGTLLVVATERFPGAILVFGLADPSHPRLLARHRTRNTASGVHTAEVARVNGRQYAFLSVDPKVRDTLPGPQLVIVDLSAPSAPVEVLARAMGAPFMHDVFVRDGTLFTAEWNDGVRAWDVGGARGGSPANPVPWAHLAIPGGAAHNVWWVHDSTTGAKRWLAIGQELGSFDPDASAGDIFVADMEHAGGPRLAAFYHRDGAGTHNFSVDERSGVLYAAYYNDGVRALDVRGDLAACPAPARRASDGLCDLAAMGREVGRFTVPGPIFVWGVQRIGTSAYASDMLNGLWKLDVGRLRR